MSIENIIESWKEVRSVIEVAYQIPADNQLLAALSSHQDSQLN